MRKAVSSYTVRKLEWFKCKTVYENVFNCSQEPYRDVNFDRDLAILFCVQWIFSLTACTLASSGYITLYFGGGGTVVSDFVTSQLSDVLQRRQSEDCEKINVQDCSILFYTHYERLNCMLGTLD